MPMLRTGAGVAIVTLAALLVAGTARADERDADRIDLVLQGMTYVASRGDANTLVIDAERAQVEPGAEVAKLEGVRARFGSKAPGGRPGAGGLDLTCDRGTFDLDTRDFVADGNVRGVTADGRLFRTDHLRYRHARSLVSTDRPVVIRDDAGTYSGGGFDYYVRQDRFRLRGGARVEQAAP